MIMRKFAVIDTETTWRNAVMSIGLAIADAQTFDLLDRRYYILLPFKYHGGMFSHALYLPGAKPDMECSRSRALEDLRRFLSAHEVSRLFAYNASFDYGHLPELNAYAWHDIMRIAAYRQHNAKISPRADCHGTGRLKRGFGVESIYRMLSTDPDYREAHNALTDAVDELHIMRLLGHDLSRYEAARIA